jgi:hypothetical protein
MSKLLTFPSETALERAEAGTPEFMRPNQVPYAVCLEGILRDEECDAIQETLMHVDPYVVKGCGAVTREIVAAPCLDIIETAARNMNDWYFKYDLDPGQHSWLQTYGVDGDYHRHMDGTPGQMRKLTAVALLSHPLSYDGGRLTMYVEPKHFNVPKTRGTVVVFQHWVEHDVSPVTSGERQTINMGFWGPPFK